jgi:glycerol-3-phosphate dehydrogenase
LYPSPGFCANAGVEVTAQTAKLMAQELDRDQAWQHEQLAQFNAIARNYSLNQH